MNKPFFKVFPTLKLDDSTKLIFEDVTVEKVSATSRQDYIRIYISSRLPIEKNVIYQVEQEIQQQLFPDRDLMIKIYEKFLLSSQYTVQTFLDIYWESLLLEFKNYDPIEYTLLRKAEFSYPSGNSLIITIEESVIAEKKAADIIRLFEKVLNERCNLGCKVSIDYTEKAQRKEVDEYFTEISQFPEKAEEPFAATNISSDNNAGSKVATQKPEEAKPEQKTQKKKGLFHPKSPKVKKNDDPNLIYGRSFDEESVKIEELVGEMGEVVVRGKVLSYERREIKNEKSILMFVITDFTDSIKVKIFAKNEQVPEIEEKLKEGAFVKVKGIALFDRFDHEVSIQSVGGIMLIPDFTTKRVDDAEIKRVELHCHTKMSDMDGVSSVEDICLQAFKWGMPGIAITDHAVTQALSIWSHFYKDKGKKYPGLEKFKVIPGVEGYLVDDYNQIVINEKGQDLDNSEIVVFDIETTGLSPIKHRIIEIGAVKLKDGEITERFSEFINPETPIPPHITRLTSIMDEMVCDAPTIDVILPRFVRFCEGAILVGHNVTFDIGFINQKCKELGLPADFTCIDTMGLSRAFYPEQAHHHLDAVCKKLGVTNDHHHRAISDAECTAKIFAIFLKDINDRGINDLSGLHALEKMDPKAVSRMRSHHIIILAKNSVGRTNLYTLISLSHLNYFYRTPKIPRSELMKYREGLIIGSACCMGELYDALLEDRLDEEIASIVNFYDYLEIQPRANNKFMIGNEKEKFSSVNSEEDILNLNRRIVKLGEQYNKPVVATCDAHFLNPEDEIYRRVIMTIKNMTDEEPAPLYVRTTDEMLEEFDYLGNDKAREVVVENTNRILKWCDQVSPVRPDKCPPVIENSDDILRKICYDRVHEIYGDPLPKIVEERLEKELHSIISNGYANLYIIAQKLVWKSVEDGYLVGSRGSVGSSFVAYAAGITEVNSLAPHYVCPCCKYSDFDSDEVKKYAGNSGCDMPDKICPKCGANLNKDGFDIPFETFLGFKGDKEPDIDLNFSGEYQAKAHKYTEVIFGYGQTFRAGTMQSVADKTAFGYVKKFFELENKVKRNAEIERIAKGCMGIRRGTGQHPGGIVVLPNGEDINSFTPIQHPANDMTTPIVTTHYDYHSIDHNLLKLDILGHDDPTMIRFLNDCTGLDPKDVPLDDKKVMDLFMSTNSIGLTPEQIGGTKLGCLGIPEFGTDFAMNMVIDAKPTSFSDLIRISGLSHGTDVWVGNAKTLIEEGTATLESCICCRDDIMVYLIIKGMDKSLSFKTMESVRKGKGLTPEMEEAMDAVGVPEWYKDSCKKIKYMFPKAHAAAYVMMAWRIGYFKVYVPQAFYAAWFSIRAKALNYEKMFQGLPILKKHMQDYRGRMDTLSNTEKDELYVMRVAEEMYERGIEVEPIDIFKAQSRLFSVVGDRIMPSLVSINKLGEKAADQIVEAAKDGPFISKDDFRQRTKCPQGVIEAMDEMGLLGNLPQSSQISIFDFL